MPFGLQGAPATFQRMMDELLRGTEGYSAAYLDDIVIYSDNWKDHMKHLKEVFRRLRKAALTVKLDKYQFGMDQCIYLGHMVGNGTVRPENSKLEALKEFPIPRTKTAVRGFLGLAAVAAWPGGHQPTCRFMTWGATSMYYQALALDQSSDVIVINLD